MNNSYEVEALLNNESTIKSLLIAIPCLALGALIVYLIGRTFSKPTL